MQILINHIGYEAHGPKQAVIISTQRNTQFEKVKLCCAKSGEMLSTYDITPHLPVDNWGLAELFTVDFTPFQQIGMVYLQLGTSRSETFEVGYNLLMDKTFSDLLHYFKSQRCSGIFDAKDRAVSILGSDKTLDVHGGWYDASGDVSKYLSHLSYANYLNPQQTPMVVWNMVKGLRLVQDHSDFATFTRVRLTDEALFGADFLVRMQDEEGFFYTTVFDKWSKDIQQRMLCAYSTQQGIRSTDYQAGFRQGAGVSIAALAAISTLGLEGNYTSDEYLRCAEKGYLHLIVNNTLYLDDGIENIIDEYCALLASTELYRATQDEEYLAEARAWAHRLSQRQLSDEDMGHFWSANQDGTRPYYHASEAGLPVISLCEYLAIEPEESIKSAVKSTVSLAMISELTITQKVSNPFGYPRQYASDLSGDKRTRFFIPHNNESGYWWQGENARLASLMAAAYLSIPHIDSPQLKQELESYAQHSADWILGLNPFDVCMLDGHGRNNPDYLPKLGFFNAKGGICNGITSGFDDERGIAFNPEPQKDDMLQNWRWGEQWIPHAAWYLLAIMAQSAHFQQAKHLKEA